MQTWVVRMPTDRAAINEHFQTQKLKTKEKESGQNDDWHASALASLAAQTVADSTIHQTGTVCHSEEASFSILESG